MATSHCFFEKNKFLGQISPYVRGVLWSLLAFFISALNDAIFKFSGLHLPGLNVLFFRFLFSALTLLPFVLFNPSHFKTKHLKIHALRGFLFTLGMIPWCMGLIELPLPLTTVISFTTSLVVILLAAVFLRESVGWQRWVATLCGFLGIVFSVGYAPLPAGAWPYIALALLATLLFATLDILNKRLLVLQENMLPMMFFSSVFTTFFTAVIVIFSPIFKSHFPTLHMLPHWITPTFKELSLLFILGLGANGFLACLLRASAAYDVSALQGLRYSELFFSSLLSIIIFHTLPSWSLILGLLFIVPATLYLGRHELKLEKKIPKDIKEGI